MNIPFQLLAQITELDPGLPALDGEGSTGTPWMIITLAVGCILLIAFKSAGRSHLD